MALSQKKLQQKRVRKKTKRTKSTPAPVKAAVRQSNFYDDFFSFEAERDARIIEILMPGADIEDREDLPEVTHDALMIYADYLERNLPINILVTGLADCGFFAWEEAYLSAYDEDNDEIDEEYEALKEERGSCTDVYAIASIKYLPDHLNIFASVERIQDGKTFVIPLEDLVGHELDESLNDIVDDYAFWKTNAYTSFALQNCIINKVLPEWV